MSKKNTQSNVISPTRLKRMIQECSQTHLQTQLITSSLSLDKQLKVDRIKLLKMLNNQMSDNLSSSDFYSCNTVDDLLTLVNSKLDSNTQIMSPKQSDYIQNISVMDEMYDTESNEINESNRFIEYRSKIISALNKYNGLRQRCAIKDEGQSYVIEKKARPFIKGYFTLAVVGKMSSGKSTFINALLGNNIIPVGWNQTTRALIEILHSDKEYVEIDYFTKEGKVITKRIDSDIRAALYKSVAVPEEYRGGFPVNEINRYILEGAEASYIISKKEELEKTAKTKLSDKQILDYVQSHPIESIPQRVTVHTNLPKEFHGWRIIDTPGVAATGGIENETREFLREKDGDGNSNVDAILFVHSARENAEDSSFAEFVHDTCCSIPDSVRDRLFLVVTRCMDKDFNRHKDDYINYLKQRFTYADCTITEGRVFLVDSILELLKKYVSASKKKIEYNSLNAESVPDGWSSDSWEDACDLTYQIGTAISKIPEFTNNNATYELMIDRCSQFKALSNSLNSFVEETRKSEYNDILSLIRNDLRSFLRKYEKEIKNLNVKKTNPSKLKKRLEGELESLEKDISDKKGELDKLRQSYQPKNITERFKVPEEKFQEIKGMKSRTDITKTISDLLDDSKQTRETIFSEIKVQTDDIIKGEFNIETEKLLDEAKKQSEDKDKPIYEKNNLFAKVVRFISGKKLFSSIVGYASDPDKEARVYADMSINSFTTQHVNIKKNVNGTIDKFSKSVGNTLKTIKEQKAKKNTAFLNSKKTLDGLEKSIKTAESYVNDIENTIKCI